MNKIEEKFLEATKNILEKNLGINKSEYVDNTVIFVYDLESKLSIELSKWYIANLQDRKNTLLIDYNKVDNLELKEQLLWLKEWSTVVLVQSTNFRLDNFRIRLNLHNRWIWCLEHTHLIYIKDDQIENYADAIEYRMPFYDELSLKLKKLSDNADNMRFICNDGSELFIEWWFEDMKQNTGNYEWKRRWWTFPIWENFTEAVDFDKVNGELCVYAYPGSDLQVNFEKPFKIQINNSKVTCNDKDMPEWFWKVLEMISKWENNEVVLRELWFGLNYGISRENVLSDINAYERIAGFHLSLWKKHQIYRKKYKKTEIQRYHIDIFPDIKEFYIGETKVFENEKYII